MNFTDFKEQFKREFSGCANVPDNEQGWIEKYAICRADTWPDEIARNDRPWRDYFRARVNFAEDDEIARRDPKFLSCRRIEAWFDSIGGRDRILDSSDIVKDCPTRTEGVAVAMAIMQTASPYRAYAIEGLKDKKKIRAGDWTIPYVRFRRKDTADEIRDNDQIRWQAERDAIRKEIEE